MNQSQYIDYLRYVYTKQDGGMLAASSVQKYGNQAMKMINDLLRTIHGNQFSIFSIEDVSELKKLRKELFALPEFKARDNSGNQMFSAGMNRYMEYAEGLLFRGKEDKLVLFDKPDYIVDSPSLPGEIRYTGSNQFARNRIKIIQSEQACNYQCQVDNSHRTFIVADSSHQYMEGHHIIPLCEQKHFAANLDCFANILVVCPTCHRFFHYANKRERNNKLLSIYDDRAQRLEKSGIILDQKSFLDAVDRQPSGTIYSY